MLTVEYLDTRGYYWTEFVTAAEIKSKLVEAASCGDIDRDKALANALGGGRATMAVDEAMSAATARGHRGVVQWLAQHDAATVANRACDAQNRSPTGSVISQQTCSQSL